MKLTAPYSGVTVEATGDAAERLIARGYKKVPAPKKKAPAKRKKD